MPSNMTIPYFKTLDAFRGICACLVALFHFQSNSIIHDVLIFQNAAVYVDFFFVLSGFVIFANYEEKLRSGYHVGKFIFLRFGRLWPLHISIFIAFILVDVLQLFIDVGDAAKYKPFSAPGETMDAVVANIFMVHSLGVLDQLSFNGPSWSISVEFYTYIIFALILSVFRKNAISVIIFLCAISVFILFYFYGNLYAKYDYGIFRCIFGFSFGAFSWKIYQSYYGIINKALLHRGVATLVESVLVIILLVCVHYFYAGYSSIIFPLIFGVFILVFAQENGLISYCLNKKIFQILGVLSYSIYMTHIFISGKMFELPIRIIEQKTDFMITTIVDGRQLYGQTVLEGTLIEIFYLLIVIVISFVSYRLVENPGRLLFKNINRKFN